MAITIPVVGMNNVKGSAVRFLSFARTPWLQGTVADHIQFEPYDPAKHYDPKTVFWILAGVYHEVRDQFRDRRAIIDVCLEAKMPVWDELARLKEPHHAILYGSFSANPDPNVIHVPNFFWYNESLQYQERGYHHYRPQSRHSVKFLMPIGRKVRWRDTVVDSLKPYLHDAYWSYVRRGRALPDEPADTAGAKRWDTRRQNPRWYDDTCFSLVLESVTQWDQAVIFVTEKTFKPIAYQHPFMVIGASGLLSYLHGQGFETFDSVFDESYDLTADLEQKLHIIKRNIDSYQKQPVDKITQQRLEHNQQLFYNNDRIKQDIRTSFVEPVLTYIGR